MTVLQGSSHRDKCALNLVVALVCPCTTESSAWAATAPNTRGSTSCVKEARVIV